MAVVLRLLVLAPTAFQFAHKRRELECLERSFLYSVRKRGFSANDEGAYGFANASSVCERRSLPFGMCGCCLTRGAPIDFVSAGITVEVLARSVRAAVDGGAKGGLRRSWSPSSAQSAIVGGGLSGSPNARVESGEDRQLRLGANLLGEETCAP